MDRVVEKIGRKNNCTVTSYISRTQIKAIPCRAGTYCGVFRRQALDRGAASLGIDHIVTGHNADDIAETVLMNSEFPCIYRSNQGSYPVFLPQVMRGDIARLGRCTQISTTGEDTIRRSKPFKYTYEKEIVMCVYFFCVIERDSDLRLVVSQVCILQETRLLLHRVHLFSRCVSWPRACFPERP